MTTTASRAATTRQRTPGTGRQAWNFLRHFLEMMVAMCVGGSALNALAFVVGPAQLGYPDLRETSPGVALLVISTLFALPMAAWMRFRGMAWRPILEMSGATIGLAVVLIALAGIDVLSADQLQRWALGFCMPACVLMLPVMLFRLGTYTGRPGEHPQHGPTAPPAR